MANLGQLAQIRGAVRGYDAGEMNEQQLQQWLIDFKEKQRQFNVQSGQQQGYLDIAKEDVQMRKQRRVEEKATFDWEQKGRDALEAKGYHPLEADKIIGGIRGQIEQDDIERTLRSYRREAITDPRFKEESIAGEIERARMAGLGVRGLEAEVEEKEAVADITVAEASVADQIANLKVKATVLGIQTAEARLQQLQQEIEAFPIDKAQRRQYMDTLIKQLEVATTGAEFENILNSILRDVTVEGRRLANKAVREGIARSKDIRAQGWYQAETGRMALGFDIQQALDQIGQDVEFNDAIVNNTRNRVADSLREINDNLTLMFSDEGKDSVEAIQKSMRYTRDNITTDINLINEVPVWREDVQYVNDVAVSIPRLISVRKMSQDELELKTRGFRFPIEATAAGRFMLTEGKEGLRTPTTTGLTLEVRQQYVDRVKQAPDAEIQAIQNEFLGKYSNAEWNKIIREAMK